MNHMVSVIVQSLAEVLQRDAAEISPTAHFAELGIDSLLGLRLSGVLSDRTGIEIDLEWLYDAPSAVELAGHLAGVAPRAAG